MTSNRYLVELEKTLNERFAHDTTQMSMSEWVCQNTTLKRKPFSFKGFEFQVQIINDMHPELYCIKPSQVGLTESQLRKFLGWVRRTTAVTGIYTMPDDIMRDRVSQTRAKPMIDADAVFNPPMYEKPIRQKGLYQIQDSFAYFTGSKEGDATSIPADILFHDEIDLTDQEMIGLFQSRLQASIYKIVQSFSTPTFSGFGIDKGYARSDQHEYVIKCAACNHYQLPEFHPRFITFPEGFRHTELHTMTEEEINMLDHSTLKWRCEKCSTPLDLADTSRREWVAKHPGRAARGYRVRPTSVNTIDIPYIFRRLKFHQQQDNMKGFFNTVLGEAFNDSNAIISEADINTCMGSSAVPDITPGEAVFLGCDVGLICHLVLGTARGAFMWLQVPRSELRDTIEKLSKKYNIVCGCIDRYPYTTLSEELNNLSFLPKIIWPVAYATTPTAPPISEKFNEFEELTHYVVNRTKNLDYVHSEIRFHRLKIEGYSDHKKLIIEHLRDMNRIELPEKAPVWNKLTGEDHFFHALGYMLLAQRIPGIQLFNSDEDPRSRILLMGGASFNSPDLSPRSLNRARAGELGRI